VLSNDAEQELVEFYEGHRCLWDKSDAGFKYKQKRTQLVEEQAKKMGLTYHKIMTWFASQRSMFGRLQKKGPSGSGSQTTTARQQWNLRNFSFLKSHVAHRTGREMGGLPDATPGTEADDDITEVEDPEEAEGDDTPQVAAAAAGAQAAGCPPRPTRTAARPQSRTRVQKIDDGMMEVMERLRRPDDPRLTAATNPRIIWGQWVGSELSNVSQDTWLHFTKDVQGLMMKYVHMDKQRQHPQQQPLQQIRPHSAPPVYDAQQQHFQPMQPAPGPSYQQQQQHYQQHQQAQMQHAPQDVTQTESFRAMLNVAGQQPYNTLSTQEQQQREQQHTSMLYGNLDQQQQPTHPASTISYDVLGDLFPHHSARSPGPTASVSSSAYQPLHTPRSSRRGGSNPSSALGRNPDEAAGSSHKE
jgi:hypothetical protein